MDVKVMYLVLLQDWLASGPLQVGRPLLHPWQTVSTPPLCFTHLFLFIFYTFKITEKDEWPFEQYRVLLSGA